MDELMSILLNPSQSIRHVHCCLLEQAIDCFQLKKWLLLLNHHNDSKEYLVAVATCKYANTLSLLLEDLGESVGVKKGQCKTVASFMEEIGNVMDNLAKKRILLCVFAVEDLHHIDHASQSAFLSIPSSYDHARILTIGEAPWGFCEQNECAGPSRTIEIFLHESGETLENGLVSAIVKKTKLEQNFVKLVVQSVIAHCHDPNFITRVCLRLIEMINSSNFSSDKEKLTFITRSIPNVMNDVESRILLKKVGHDGNDVLSMPIFCQLLLLASYCATHNSAASDKRYFVKHHGREKRNDAKERAVELAAEQKENGLKSADIQRIYFMFQVFVNQCKDETEAREKIILSPLSFDVLPQLATLEKCSLVLRTSSYANLDQPKVRCMISLETAQKIAKRLNIKIEDYLERWI